MHETHYQSDPAPDPAVSAGDEAPASEPMRFPGTEPIAETEILDVSSEASPAPGSSTEGRAGRASGVVRRLVPRLPWHVRLKIAVVLSFVILVAVLILKRPRLKSTPDPLPPARIARSTPASPLEKTKPSEAVEREVVSAESIEAEVAEQFPAPPTIPAPVPAPEVRRTSTLSMSDVPPMTVTAPPPIPSGTPPAVVEDLPPPSAWEDEAAIAVADVAAPPSISGTDATQIAPPPALPTAAVGEFADDAVNPPAVPAEFVPEAVHPELPETGPVRDDTLVAMPPPVGGPIGPSKPSPTLPVAPSRPDPPMPAVTPDEFSPLLPPPDLASPPASDPVPEAVATESRPATAARIPTEPAPIPDLETPPPTQDEPAGELFEIPKAGEKKPTVEAASPMLVTAGTTPDLGPSAPSRVSLDPINPVVHVVRRGENFWTISRYHYASGRYYKALWYANRDKAKTPAELYIGTVLRIPSIDDLDASRIEPATTTRVAGRASEDGSRRDPRTERTSRDDDDRLVMLPVGKPSAEGSIPPEAADLVPRSRSLEPSYRWYTVRPHETPRSIAREELGDSSRETELLRLNPDESEDGSLRIRTGMKIKIPDDSTRRE